jgi:hypothetical protein
MPNAPSTGLPHPQSYASIDELVLDEVTGLAWQAELDEGPGESGGFTWQEALDHCDALELGGHDDFRLPTRLELVSILDVTTNDPAIETEAFPGTPPTPHWTASTPASDEDQAFRLDFGLGGTSSGSKDAEQAVRCVRNHDQPPLPPPDERFRIEGGTVLDRMTGLRWERTPTFEASKPTEEASSFARAASYCSSLVINGNASFRVPSVNELQTLVNETNPELAIDSELFPGVIGEGYWSTSLLAGDPESAWFVNFSDGFSGTAVLTTPRYVRCVR